MACNKLVKTKKNQSNLSLIAYVKLNHMSISNIFQTLMKVHVVFRKGSRNVKLNTRILEFRDDVQDSFSTFSPYEKEEILKYCQSEIQMFKKLRRALTFFCKKKYISLWANQRMRW